MRIDILCTDPAHPFVPFLLRWRDEKEPEHHVRLIHDTSELLSGDILFLVSCSQVISTGNRERYRHVLVLHASDLPRGRGWSPHVWNILEGERHLTLSLLTAEPSVDTGDIWVKIPFFVSSNALYGEINNILFATELEAMSQGIELVARGFRPQKQEGSATTYYPRRTPADSKIDPEKSITAQFDLMRVSDPNRFPAFFVLHGHTYELTIRKKRI